MALLRRRSSGSADPSDPSRPLPAPEDPADPADLSHLVSAAPEGQLPSVAVMTMARDEGAMLGRWVRHYAAQVGAEHVYVVDDQTTDGSTDDLAGPVLRIPPLRKRGFEPSRMEVMAGLSAGLLAAYDAVVFCDTDEFIVPDPDHHASLLHYVAARPGRQAVGVTALNVVHDVSREGPLRDDAPVLSQRALAKFAPLMCKPSLKWVPARWAHASHGIECPYAVDPELFMFHLKFADRDHLADAAAKRHAAFRDDGRAARTSWERPADEMVDLLDEITADIDLEQVERFRPRPARLERIVQRQGAMWRATGAGQVQAMRSQPMVRVPRRFRDLV